MRVIVNGKVQEFKEKQLELLEVLKRNNITKPELVSVQLNGSFVKRDVYHDTQLHENDAVDFLFFMGGGSQLSVITLGWN